ncbi:MAG TPA: HAD family phosphatase [Acidimicrobiales bacterium]|nr:HAD family phosphatase [Acidimicrobiales bacterium]
MGIARIEAVLWDFGGVFTPSPFHAGRRFAEAKGLDFDGLFAAVFGSYHADTDHPWHRVERGEMALADAFAEITTTAQRSGVSFDMKELFASMSDDGIDRTIVADKVRALRASGLRMGIVTNNVREFSERWRRLIPVDELFDDIVDSSAVGVRKPNPDIYHLALRRLGVTRPDSAIFLDDFAPNVDAAIAIGLHGVVVDEDPRRALVAIDQIIAGA